MARTQKPTYSCHQADMQNLENHSPFRETDGDSGPFVSCPSHGLLSRFETQGEHRSGLFQILAHATSFAHFLYPMLHPWILLVGHKKNQVSKLCHSNMYKKPVPGRLACRELCPRVVLSVCHPVSTVQPNCLKNWQIIVLPHP